ncbi:MAG: hypothetical protein OEY29_00690 [Gammaproteobacteria bacterium]|nr:hypothetical protein [Gammaproteobacteria bacterium]
MTQVTAQQFTEGNRVRILSSGQVVTIQKISGHGAAIVEYDFGYRSVLMLNELASENSAQENRHVA